MVDQLLSNTQIKTQAKGGPIKSWEAGPAQDEIPIDLGSGDVNQVCRAIYVGTGGTLVTVPIGHATDDGVTKINIPDGALWPSATRKFIAAGTTCDDIVALI